jgi:hypothetical protein
MPVVIVKQYTVNIDFIGSSDTDILGRLGTSTLRLPLSLLGVKMSDTKED